MKQGWGYGMGTKKGNSISIRFLGVGLFELEIMHFIPSCKTKAIWYKDYN